LPDPRPTAAPLPAQARDLVGLVVQPDAALRAALVHLLEGRGAAVLEAEDAPSALALLEELGILPDFLLADGPGGPDAACACAAALAARHPGIPAMVLAADRSEAFRTACAAAGAGVLAKPLDPAALDRFLAEVARG
jgi:CheY-like chemotaxis protein